MNDWNVVVTTRERHYAQARAALAQLGRVDRTHYYGVLAMLVDDVPGFLSEVSALLERNETARQSLAHVCPVTETFSFHTPEEFEAQARAAVLRFAPQLGGKRFHVRMHRRGFRGRLQSMIEERSLDEALLASLRDAGRPGRVDFEDPDYIVMIETLDQRAGLALWSREDRARYPFIAVD